MGLTAPGVGIHGTPDSASIGYSASHGCIRMRIPEAEWLFGHVQVGTPVFIVSA
jgi:lipoprotein-anchoring transpeptidase ErfK/SrfK